MQNAGGSPKKSTRPKQIAAFALKLLVSGSLLYFVLSRTGISEVIGIMAEIDPVRFAGAIGIFILMVLLCSLRWGLLLPDHFSQRRLFPLYMIGSFFNIFLPGLVGGDVVKVYYLYRETQRGAHALASVFMDRYIGYAGLMALGLLAYPFGFRSFQGSWITPVLPGIVALFIITSLVLFLARPGGRFAFISRLHDYFDSYWKDRPVLLKALGVSLCVHILSSISVWLISTGLGAHVPLTTLFVFVPVIATLAALPISISGLGIREAAFVLLLGTQGISPEKATAISFAWFLAFAAGGLPGIFFYLREKGSAAVRQSGEKE
ncbi:MAG: flippase-like domain-containing protein [Thermodesulfovibrionales bacterium]|nr:flippase-like domain-containing protein [Thermodesulfovibrionales bacterium]